MRGQIINAGHSKALYASLLSTQLYHAYSKVSWGPVILEDPETLSLASTSPLYSLLYF